MSPAALVTTPVTADLLRGALEVEATARGVLPHRLTRAARRQNTDPGLALAETQPSGVRLAVRTRATVVELEAHATRRAFVGAPAPSPGVYDLLVDGRPTAQGHVSGGSTLSIDMTTGSTTAHRGRARHGALRGPARRTTRPSRSGCRTPRSPRSSRCAPTPRVEPAPASDRPVWVHHGSSVSHGSNAASPSTTWPAVAARLGGVDLVNLGFGGGALLDPFTARAIRDTPADLLSVKVGINVVNLDAMRLRAFVPAVDGFLDTIREGHPDDAAPGGHAAAVPHPRGHPRPGRPRCGGAGRGPGALPRHGRPGRGAAGRLTLRVIRRGPRRRSSRAARPTTPTSTSSTGSALYGEADHVDHPLPDALHPDAATHQFVGERFAATVFRDDGPFGAARR